jgi:hypothetical protein
VAFPQIHRSAITLPAPLDLAKMTFSFGTEDMTLSPIGEGDEESYSAGDEEVSEDYVNATKVKTATLAAIAEKEISELSNLLGKLKTGTATKNEKDRLRSVNARLDGLKMEIDVSKTRESEAEVKMLRSTMHRKTMDVRKSLKEKEVRSVVRAVCAAESVDLAFILDCTGSMSSYIASVKRSINDIVRRVKSTNGNLKLRLAMLGYRDLSDGAKQFESLDFVSSVDEFESFVGRLGAHGGDDAPEDIAGAIQKANALSWSQQTRVAFLIADSPCHGKDFHRCFDSYPDGTPGVDIITELNALSSKCASNGTMTINFGRITSQTDMMLHRFEECGVMIDVVSLDDVCKITACVTKSVRKSIFKTMTLAAGGTKSVAFAPMVDIESLLHKSSSLSGTRVSLKEYCILPKTPDVAEWRKQNAVPVKVYRNRSVDRVVDLQEPLGIGVLEFWRARTDRTREATMFMRQASDPFAEGEIRIAYHGQLARGKKGLDDISKSKIVLKAFKHHGKGLNDRRQYFGQMEVSNIAHFLANEYNKSPNRPGHCARITVLQVCVVEEEDEEKEKHGTRRFCGEEYLPNDMFVKYSNNTGQWDEDNIDESLLRFTDFTYQVTNGYLMVTDLQGVQKDNTFILTDPVILCKDILRFGGTNLGEKFMKKCIDSTRAYMVENRWH